MLLVYNADMARLLQKLNSYLQSFFTPWLFYVKWAFYTCAQARFFTSEKTRAQSIWKLIEQKNSHGRDLFKQVGMFYLNFSLNFGIPPVLVFQLEVYYKYTDF